MRIAPLRALLLCVALACSTPAFAKSPFTFDAMMKLARISEPQLSPDGKLVAFTVQTVDFAEQYEAFADLHCAAGGRRAESDIARWHIQYAAALDARRQAHILRLQSKQWFADLVNESGWQRPKASDQSAD